MWVHPSKKRVLRSIYACFLRNVCEMSKLFWRTSAKKLK
jgi:hypothetical protein